MEREPDLTRPAALRLLASEFGITPAEVTQDVHQISEWRGSNDDLLVGLEQRHKWSAKTAANYLSSVLFVLGRLPRRMGPSPEA